jgi:hypothetical protein
VIVKLHHDYLLSPKNTEQDTNTLPPEFKKNLIPVLEGVHLIIVSKLVVSTNLCLVLVRICAKNK